MTLRFLAISTTPNTNGTYDAHPVRTVLFDGSTLIDRTLEDVTLRIEQTPDGHMHLDCPDPSDAQFLASMCISMDALWAKTQTYLQPGEEFLSYKADGRTMDVEIWDDSTPLPTYLTFATEPPKHSA